MPADRALNAFLQRYLKDQVAGARRSLAEYQASFPGCEALIAERWPYLDGNGEHAAREGMPERVGPYLILEEIGRGGQGVVYLGEDQRLGRKAAVKVLSGLGSIAPDRVARFLREAEVASRLDHPGIATVYETGTDGDVPYIAMRYVEGETLAVKMAASDLGVEDVARLIAQAARALDAAHEGGVVHRDVKPGNILVTPDGEPVIVDFGLAHDSDDDLAAITRTGEFFGTPAYMSPEQIAAGKNRPDRRTDVWSLGVTLYEGLTGRRPFEAPTREGLCQAITSQEPLDIRIGRPSIDRDLRVIVQTALRKDRGRRYRSAAAMAADLEAWLEGRPIAARPVGRIEKLVLWTRREPALAALLAVLLVALPTIAAFTTHYLSNRASVERARLLALEDEKDQLIAEGSELFINGKRAAAIDVFRKATRLEGGSEEALAGMVFAMLYQSRAREAIEILDSEGASLSKRRSGMLLRAQALEALGNHTAATALRESLAEPKDALDFYFIGHGLNRQPHVGGPTNYAEADRALARAVLLCSRPRAHFYLSRAESASNLPDLAATEDVVHAIQQHWGARQHVAYFLGQCLHNLKRYEDALVKFREAVAAEPRYARAHTFMGRTLVALGRPDEAIEAHRKAVEVDPSVALWWTNLGGVLGDRGRHSEALVALREALRLDPNDASAHADLAVVLRKLGRIEDALTQCHEAVRLDPKSSRAHTLLGWALLESGRIEAAVREFGEGAALDPSDAGAMTPLGVGLARWGRSDESIAVLKKAILLDRGYARAYSDLVEPLIAKGRIEEAIEAALTSVRLGPGAAAHRYHLGLAFDEAKQDEHAEAAYRQAILLNPEHAEAHCNLGRLLRKHGKYKEALELYRRGHELGSKGATWRYPSAGWISRCEELIEAEARLERIVGRVESPRSLQDELELADLAAATRRYELAASWYLDLFNREPEIASGADVPHRLRAARAAFGADIVGTESRSSAESRPGTWRRQALEWLREDLSMRRRLVEEETWTAVQLEDWAKELLADRSFAASHGPSPSVPKDEQESWLAFWKEVGDASR